jgi:heme oxygenase
VDVLSKLMTATRGFHADADACLQRVIASGSLDDYRQFLVDTYRWIAPIERAVHATPAIAAAVDGRRLRKTELVVRDLLSLSVRQPEVDKIVTCVEVPAVFEDAARALGWMFTIERSTLLHNVAFHTLARQHPGEMAFAASYLKCYFGSGGEAWQSFGALLEAAITTDAAMTTLLASASAAFEAHRHCADYASASYQQSS